MTDLSKESELRWSSIEKIKIISKVAIYFKVEIYITSFPNTQFLHEVNFQDDFKNYNNPWFGHIVEKK